MYLAYVDESGDVGAKGSRSYVLACVLVQAGSWPSVFDDLIDFRRFLKRTFGLPIRAEVKASHLLRNAGAFAPLALTAASRHRLYRLYMRVQPKIGVETFAIVIDKHALVTQQPAADPRETCWERLLQRLERLSTKSGAPVMLVHDEGERLLIRKLARKARRAGTAGSAFGTGLLRRPATLLIDDPVPRASDQSYLIQLADLNAYAAFRRCFPPPLRTAQIVPQTMWDQLGPARFAAVHGLAGSAYPGIVLSP